MLDVNLNQTIAFLVAISKSRVDLEAMDFSLLE
jgi:hypothetical protein